MLDRPSWDIDSQGWEVEYRLLYTAPQPAEQQPDVQGYVMVPAKEFESVLNRADWRTAKNRAELRHMLKALQSSAAPDVAGLVEHQLPSSYPVSGNVFFRESTGEWVLEITASINGAEITARHTQPADTRPEDVIGLPALYEATSDISKLVEALERSVAGFDALSGMASLDAGARNYARQKALALNAILAAYRKGGSYVA